MKHASKEMINTAAEVMNGHLADNTSAGAALRDKDAGPMILEVVNGILAEAAEGGRLVRAVESSGELLGFVPRMNIPIPELPQREKPTPSPDEKK